MHDADQIVMLYELCKSVSPRDERLLVRSFNGEVRAALWHHHLNNYLTDSDLNDVQRAVIEEGLELLSTRPWSPADIEGGDWSQKEATLQEHRLHAESVFSKRRIIEIFFTFRRLELVDLDRWPD